MRVRKMGNDSSVNTMTASTGTMTTTLAATTVQMMGSGVRKSTTVTTTTWTTLFPMYPCMVTGPYQGNQSH